MGAAVRISAILLLALSGKSFGDTQVTSEDVIIAIDKALRFLSNNSQNVHADLLFGVAVTQGQLHSMRISLESMRDRQGNWNGRALIEKIKNLEYQCWGIFQSSQDKIITNNDVTYTNMVRALLSPWRWHWRAARPLALRWRRPSDTETRAGAPLLRTLRQGWPKERASDACLAEVLLGRPCAAPSLFCRRAERGRDGPRARGYPLTHRLLYAVIVRQNGCAVLGPNDSVEDAIDDLCSNVLVDAELIERLAFPLYARDLFCEQVALCGVEGFQEFLRPGWIKKILSWQTTMGCFGNKEDIENSVQEADRSATREKRSDGALPGGCLQHFTGVAMAAMAASLRALLA